MPHPFLAVTSAMLEELGHDIIWELVGHWLRHGTCRRCGLSVAISEADGYFSARGPALIQPCPKAAPEDDSA